MRQEREMKTYEIIKNIYNQITESFYSIENNNLSTGELDTLISETMEDIKLAYKYLSKLNVYELIHKADEVDTKAFKNNVKAFKTNIEFIQINIEKILNFKSKVKCDVHQHHTPPEMWDEFDHQKWSNHVEFEKMVARSYNEKLNNQINTISF